ncbi:type II toxin-antitoxin system PemK/MazF family toxin [Streptomyces sp. A475]|uniref:type II toxin-antitoxin system PemK/MazF family toxin n=1 Tax=Streptomyces sp. A475 TaxID=3131976 RepID=UPI0030C9CB4E
MQRGEVWWVEFDERRLVVLLSGDGASGIRVMQIVAPADVDVSDLGIEVTVGAMEGLPLEGVLRVAFPRPGFTPCTWLTTVSRDDLIEQAGVLSFAKLSEIEDALRLAEQAKERTPATTAKLSKIRDALRLGELGWTEKEPARATAWVSSR